MSTDPAAMAAARTARRVHLSIACYDPFVSSKGSSRRRRRSEPGRPSLFFIITLTLGVLLLAWAFIVVISRPPKPQKLGFREALRYDHAQQVYPWLNKSPRNFSSSSYS